MFLTIFLGEMPFRVSNTTNSIKFHIDNSERCNVSNQRIIEKRRAVSNKISTLVVLQDNKYSIEYDIFLHLHVKL